MPTVRLTYPKDIRREGREVIEVSDDRARVLIEQRRGVILHDAAAVNVEPPTKLRRAKAKTKP